MYHFHVAWYAFHLEYHSRGENAMTYEMPNTFNVTFSVRDNADAIQSDTVTITIDISDMTSDDIREWMCNNGIVVYCQGRVRAGKMKDGDVYKLHKPGTRTVSVAVLEGEQLAKARILLESIGKATPSMSAEDVTKEFHILRRALEKLRKATDSK
jgi:hypothetical protein